MRGKLDDAQFVALRDDPRPLKAAAAAFGVTENYARMVRDGTYTRAAPRKAPAPTRVLPKRHYRPFQDGTYP